MLRGSPQQDRLGRVDIRNPLAVGPADYHRSPIGYHSPVGSPPHGPPAMYRKLRRAPAPSPHRSSQPPPPLPARSRVLGAYRDSLVRPAILPRSLERCLSPLPLPVPKRGLGAHARQPRPANGRTSTGCIWTPPMCAAMSVRPGRLRHQDARPSRHRRMAVARAPNHGLREDGLQLPETNDVRRRAPLAAKPLCHKCPHTLPTPTIRA